MRTLKTLGVLAALTLGAATANAAEVPQSLQQLEQWVGQTHPINERREGVDQAFNQVVKQSAQAYENGDIATGQKLEAFARHIAGVDANVSQTVASNQ
jgi:hypothetical protein